MDLLYFILLVSVLIFIHESGHFAFAKIFGVKVITFSIGFGPKVIRIRGKETEYCIALLPFGGFVKMLEESGPEPILPEDRKRTFESMGLWKRIVIVLAGPAMNVLFPIALYTSVFLEDRAFLPPTVGVVLPGRPADGKLVAGDRIVSIDGKEVGSFPDVQSIVARGAGKAMRVVVERDGHTVETTLTPADEVETRELDIVDHVGRVGIVPTFPEPVIGVPRTDSPAYRAGLRTFDRVVAISGRKVDRLFDLQSALAANRGDTVVLTYLRPVDAPNAMGGLCDLAVMTPQVATLTPLAKPADSPVVAGDANDRAADVLARAGIEGSDLYASFVPEASSEWLAGLRTGDRLMSLDGKPARSWESLNTELAGTPRLVHELAWTREGQPMAGTFQLRREQWDDELGQHYERYVFRTTHWVPVARGDLVPNPHPLIYAIGRGFEETGSVIRFIAVGFVRILQGRVSLSNVSGPITLYDIAGQAGAKGPAYFVWAMALISVNLGLLNLLPIPVLDGGHLAFFLVEGIRRRPLPLRVREVASLVGMTVLVALMLLAFKNDVERRWDVIVGELREIFHVSASKAPHSARAIAAQVLVRVDKDAAFAAAALDTELTRAAQLAARDRALATELAYGTLRVRPWLDARIVKHAKKGIAGLEPRARAHLEIAAYQLFFLTRVPPFAAVNEAVDLVRATSGARVAAFANAVLRALSAEAARETPRIEEALVASSPAWLKDALSRALGADAVGPYLASGAEAPPLGIRIEDSAARDAWLARFREAAPDATFELGVTSPAAILGRGAGKPQLLPGWAEGEWSVQEEGSQLVALALGARAGETVLDACAGRGNKTGALAAAVGAAGAVDAADVHPAKLEALARDLSRTRRAVRACYAVDWSVGSGDVPRDFDRVLVDAPCSGVGTLRRRPDLQARREEGDLASLPALQRAILARAADHVRPGGRLVYAVCSVLREEAEDVVASLLADRADLALAPFDSTALALAAEAPTLRLLPHVHGTDGYFVASLVRRP